ncbi:MAG: hypothetical protein K0S11_1480, partial [Gammaproteobacteria bacterium]|nr:hypothetical protein [Gammaproteobacteria bacterium]
KYKQNPDRKVLNFGFLFIVLLYATLILENYYGSNFKTAIKNPSKGNESAQKLFQTISQEDRQAKNFLWLNNIDVKQVTGDHATNTLWVPEISNKNFKIELIGALSKENLYSHLANARYSLKVNLDIFMKSMDATTCRIHYTLVDNKTHKVIYSDAISATVIGRFLDNRPLEAFFTVVKANIKKFIEALAQLPEEASE